MRFEGRAEAAIKSRIASAWRSWRELASLLVNQSIPLVSRAQVYRACVRPVLLYGAETWALTKHLEGLLRSCDTTVECLDIWRRSDGRVEF